MESQLTSYDISSRGEDDPANVSEMGSKFTTTETASEREEIGNNPCFLEHTVR
jgi:hypothetical protein